MCTAQQTFFCYYRRKGGNTLYSMSSNLQSPAHNGLTRTDVERLRAKYGANILPRAERHRSREWLKRLVSPISLMLIAASALSFIVGKQFDGWFIIALLALNIGISFWHERKADHALKLLEERVTSKVKVLRDTVWRFLDSRELVPGDVVELVGGSVVPADAEVLPDGHVTVNESALTGESLPVEKHEGDTLSMGSFIASGTTHARITAIGGATRFGNVIARESGPRKRSVLERDILEISRFLSGIAIVLAAVLTVALLASGSELIEVIRLDLTLLIAGVPVALPVVMSLIISVGVLRLSERAAIVRRLAALEDFANVDLLLSDKTGTLTKNEIQVQGMVTFGAYSEEEAAALAATTTGEASYRTLEQAIADHAQKLGVVAHQVITFTPADATRKHSTVLADVGGTRTLIVLGAPQVIEHLAVLDAGTRERFDRAVTDAGVRGNRALALAVRAVGDEPEPAERDLSLVAIFLLSDELRDDARDAIMFLNENGVLVKMLTGDNVAIAREVGKQLGLGGSVLRAGDAEMHDLTEATFGTTSVFAEILPEDKERLVRLAQKRHAVAVTGDGVNDLPAVRAANVGIAVANAVDALKGVADIILTENGIGVIRDAVIESRKIFMRIYSYSIYRISESFRVILTVALFGALFLAPILTPLQLLMLALLNDLPIISLAFNRVHVLKRPAVIDAKRRFVLSTLYGSVGIMNSLLFFFLARDLLHLPWDMIQTLFFLKLTVSGHMLVFVAHTQKRWYQFLPSRTVIVATVSTQIIATLIALFGLFMTAIPIALVALVWLWAFLWMQVSDLMKWAHSKIPARVHTVAV